MVSDLARAVDSVELKNEQLHLENVRLKTRVNRLLKKLHRVRGKCKDAFNGSASGPEA